MERGKEMIHKVCMGLAAAVLAAAMVGCGGEKNGGDSEGGASLQERFTKAMADTSPDSKAEALIEIGQLQFRAGDSSGATTSFREATTAAKAIGDAKRRADTEAKLASAFAKTNNKIEAGKLLKSAATVSEKITVVQERIESLSDIAEVYAVDIQELGNAGSKLKDAEKLADGITEPVERLQAFAPIMYGYRKANKTADIDRIAGKAAELTAGITEPRQKVTAIKTFARALIEANSKEDAFNQLAAAADIARKVEGNYERAYALTDVAEQYAFGGNAEKMEELLKEVDKLADGIDVEKDRPQMLQTRDRAKRLRTGK
jgi:hypothetical protein